MAKVRVATKVRAAGAETLVALCEAILKGQAIDAAEAGQLASALEKRAEKIEYQHFNSDPHLKAAQTLRDDVAALKEMQARLIAGRKAIPDFVAGETYRAKDLVRSADGIFQAKRATNSVPRSGPDWTLVAGKEAALPSSAKQKATRPWPVDPSLQKPAVPGLIRDASDREAYGRHLDFCVNNVMQALAKTGAAANSPVSYDLLATVNGALTALQEWTFQQMNAVGERLAALEATGIKFSGVWQRATGYQRGCVVTHQGSAWCAVRDHEEPEEPGKSDCWQLMVKRGADGKDAK